MLICSIFPPINLEIKTESDPFVSRPGTFAPFFPSHFYVYLMASMVRSSLCSVSPTN